MNRSEEIVDEPMFAKTTRVLTEFIEQLSAEIVDDGNHIYNLSVQFDNATIVHVSGSAGVVVAGLLDALRFMLPRLVQSSLVRIDLRDGFLREFQPLREETP